jgi:hypothetical protein
MRSAIIFPMNISETGVIGGGTTATGLDGTVFSGLGGIPQFIVACSLMASFALRPVPAGPMEGVLAGAVFSITPVLHPLHARAEGVYGCRTRGRPN